MHVFIRVFVSVFLYKWYDNSTNLQTNSRKWQYWWQWQWQYWWQGLDKVLTDLVNKFTVIGVTFGILNWDFVCIVYGLVDGLSTDYSRNVYRSFPKCRRIVFRSFLIFPNYSRNVYVQIILNIPVYCYCLRNSMYNPELNYHYPISH